MTSVTLTTYHVNKGVPTGERNIHDVTPVLDSYPLDRVKLLDAPAAYTPVVQELYDAGLAETVFDNYTYEVHGWAHYVYEREQAGAFGPAAPLKATPVVIRGRVGELFAAFRDGVPAVTLVSGPKDGIARQRIAKNINDLKTAIEGFVPDERESIHANDREWLDKLFAAPLSGGDYHPKQHANILVLVAQFFDYLHDRARLFEDADAADAMNRYRAQF